MPFVGAGVGGLAAGLSAFGKKNPQFNYKQSALEREGSDYMQQGLTGYANAIKNEVAQGSQAQLDLADMLKNYASGGNLPGTQDWFNARQFTSNAFQPQQVAMQQAFQDQLTNANRMAALSGRGQNDPVLRAKLAQEQTRQSAQLNAQQGAAASQMALQLPGQRLQFTSDRANTLVNRGQNALSAQSGLFGMGNTAVNTERSFATNMALADFQQQQLSTSFAQRLGGTLQGAIQGAGAGMSMQSMQSQNNFRDASAANMGSGGGQTYSAAGGGNTYQGYGLGQNGNYFGSGAPQSNPFQAGMATSQVIPALSRQPASSGVNYGQNFGPSAGLSMSQFNSDASAYQQGGQLLRFGNDPYTVQYSNPQMYGPSF